MTAREIIDNLSDSLLGDPRILSVSDRELLTNLLQRANMQACVSGNAVPETIARLVGEIIAERAYGILGDSVVQRLLQSQPVSSSEWPGQTRKPIRAGTPPVPPANLPPSPRPPSPGPPAITDTAVATKTAGVAVLERPEVLPAQCVVLDEFLTPTQLRALTQHTLEHEMQFQISEVISPGHTASNVDYDQRRSHVLMDLGLHRETIVERLQACLPKVLEKLGVEKFPISRIETQITASNHGDFFRWHTDDGSPEISTREITFVYFFHREPKNFRGGELRIYESRRENNGYVPTANSRTIVSEQNQMVLFRSSLAHEITPVDCSSGAFADSRFTVNGWLHR